MISPDVEVVLHRSFVSAREKRHRFVTVEHMVIEMLAEAPVVEHLKSCAVNVDALRADLEASLSKFESSPDVEEEPDTQPTTGFQRVIQKAIMEAQTSGPREVSLIDLLMAILGEKKSFVATRLWESCCAKMALITTLAGLAPTLT